MTVQAPVLMIQGTASSVGKSILVTALCRLYRQRGYRVAPFKAQNMALNSFVTPDGKEIGRAQAVQAEAARVAPTSTMNPVLLKPEGDRSSQVVVLGERVGTMGAVDYHRYKPRLRGVIADCLAELRAEYDLVVIEGAGSPAEINLKQSDIVNMDVARRAEAPVLLVGDIDRGGLFAAFVGTLELLEPEERALVRGFVVNKFRGDPSLLEPGLAFLRERTGVPVVGLLPYARDLRVADEDSIALDDRVGRVPRPGHLDVAVVRVPRISNFDDVEALEHEPGVVLRFVDDPAAVAAADLVILPGSKSVVTDLAWMRERGLADAVVARAAEGRPVLGLCGGCQMLGERIDDPLGVEAPEPGGWPGLGVLALRTRFGSEKITSQVRGRVRRGSFVCPAGTPVRGYEIHMGQVEHAGGEPFAELRRAGSAALELDGAVSGDGNVVGTLVHGFLDGDAVRASLLAELRSRRGLPAPDRSASGTRDASYDRLADLCRAHLDLESLDRIVGLRAPGRAAS